MAGLPMAVDSRVKDPFHFLVRCHAGAGDKVLFSKDRWLQASRHKNLPNDDNCYFVLLGGQGWTVVVVGLLTWRGAAL